MGGDLPALVMLIAGVVAIGRSRPRSFGRLAVPGRAPVGGVSALGAAVRHRLGRRWVMAVRVLDGLSDRFVGWAILVAVAATVAWPPALAVAPLSAAVRSTVRARSRRRSHAISVVRELSPATELVRMAVGAGYTVPAAIGVVGPFVAGPLGVAIRRAGAEVDRGRSVSAALDDLARSVGPDVDPLVRSLRDGLGGAAIGDSLDRAAVEARRSRRQRADELMRRIPVTMLFPLVFCVLPAFVLLTLVPVVAVSVRQLQI